MSGRWLCVTLERSLIGERPRARACVRGLGLSRIRHVVRLPETPEHLGLIRKVRHLVSVQEDASERN